MARYRELSTAEMNPAQKAVVDEIVSGKRGRFGGPFQLLVRAPEVCRHLSRLGEYLRWGSSLSPALSELAICLTARHIRANYEWHVASVSRWAVGGSIPGTTDDQFATNMNANNVPMKAR
jgi:4-carboxymuconolactone decarboxylase